jgi:hypothetical protein
MIFLLFQCLDIHTLALLTIIAPSWSWAGVDGVIEYFHMIPIDKYAEHEVFITIIDTNCTPSSAKQIGNRYTGELIIKGPLRSANVALHETSLHYRDLEAGFRQGDRSDRDFEAGKNLIKEIVESVERKRKRLFYPHLDNIELEGKEESSTRLDQVSTPEPSTRKAETIPSSQDKSLPSFTEYLGFIENATYDPESEWNKRSDHPQLHFRSRREVGNRSGPYRYAGHPLRHPVSGAQVGYWAPDYEGMQNSYSVMCLAVSKYRNYVVCLGLERIGETETKYKRVGLAFWYGNAWDEVLDSEIKEVVIV